MALVYLPIQDKIINADNIDYADTIGRTDAYSEPHVVIKFGGGNFLEFPPEVTLYEVYAMLNEGVRNAQ